MRVFGHRGSPGFPRFGENTRTSFRKALDEGAAGFELDVRRSADRTLIVLHDPTIDRTTNGSGRASSLTYDQISGFDAGYGDSIPRFSDILDEFANRCVLHIELKESGLAGDVADLILQRDPAPDVVVSAFDTDDNDKGSSASWSELQAIAPRVPIALLATRKKIGRLGAEAFLEAARRHSAEAIHPARTAATRELIGLARNAGVRVRVWTINDPAEAVRFQKLGVDAIFSDLPEICHQL